MTTRGAAAHNSGQHTVSPDATRRAQTRLDRPAASTPSRHRWVYLHRDAAEGVLYVGCTNDLRRRTSDHRRKSPWGSLIARVEVDSYREGGDALRREMELIRTHEPPHNVRSNPVTERAYRAEKDATARARWAAFWAANPERRSA